MIKRGVFLFFFVAALSWSGNIGSVESVTGVDVSQSVSESQWKCLQSPGGQGPVEFAIVRVYRSSGTLDPNGASSIIAAKAAGIKYVDGYIFPCVTCGDPEGQVRDTKSGLENAGAEYGMLWYDIERYAWSSDKISNQDFIKKMIDEGQRLGVKAGIYTNWNSWAEIVGRPDVSARQGFASMVSSL